MLRTRLCSRGNGLRKILEAFLICFILVGTIIALDVATSPIINPNPIRFPAMPSSGPSYSGHIVFITLENHPLSSVTCSGCASYMTSLGNSYASSANYVGPVSSSWKPSLPNYLGLFSGQTWGCVSDSLPNAGCTIAPWTCSSVCNIVDRFSAAGISWKGYMEGMPGPNICNSNGGSDGTVYVAHHNPFVYFGNIVNNSTRCSLVVPSGSSGGATSCGTSVTASAISNLVSDLNGTAPNFSWVTPNRIDDSHDCGVQQANSWLSVVVPAILTTKTFETDVSATAVITFDEPTAGTYGTTPVYFVVAGPGARPYYTSSTKFTHLNWLATIESNWSLSCLVSRNDCGAIVMSGFFANQYGEFQASFTDSPSNPPPNQPITFTASVSGGVQPYSYTWTFGDGSSGTGQTVSHSYAQAGSFTTSLTVTDVATHVVTVSQVLMVGATGLCLQCLFNALSSSPQLLIGLATGLTLTASAAILAKRRSHPANPGTLQPPESSESTAPGEEIEIWRTTRYYKPAEK
jgi:hypothetical protein